MRFLIIPFLEPYAEHVAKQAAATFIISERQGAELCVERKKKGGKPVRSEKSDFN